MVTPIDIKEYADWRREELLREAEAYRLARQAMAPRRPCRVGLAAALRAMASRLEGDLRPVGERPTVAVG